MVVDLALTPPWMTVDSPRGPSARLRRVSNPSTAWTTDRELLAAVLAEDPRAEEQFVARYRGLILGLARSRFGLHGGAAEDLLQTTLETLWRDDRRILKAWRGEGRFSTYLSVIVCRLCRRDAADSQRRRTVAADPSVLDRLVSDQPGADATTLDHERLAAIRGALAGLSPRDRLVIAWRFFDDLAPSDFAPQLGISAGAARKALHDALRRLRAELARQTPEDPPPATDAGASGESR